MTSIDCIGFTLLVGTSHQSRRIDTIMSKELCCSYLEEFVSSEKAFCALQLLVALQYLVAKSSVPENVSRRRVLSSKSISSSSPSLATSFPAFSVNAKYRPRCMERRFRYCLNGFCGLTSGSASSENVAAVGEMLRDRMQSVQSAFISENGVDYVSMKGSPVYAEFRRATAELHNIGDLGTVSEKEAMAFYLNLYNCMVLHAEVEVGHPGGMLERRRFYGKCCYQIGDCLFSLNDIEHGILRCNRTPPGAFFPMFSAKDVRRQLSFKKLDSRIHFALNCGAKSCPPIRVYSSSNVERVLQMAAEGFCQFNVVVDMQSNTVCLSKIFQWYKGDFITSGASDKAHRELLDYICRYLPQDHLLHACKAVVKVIFAPYNWSQNEDVRVAESIVQEAIQFHYGDMSDKEINIHMDWLSRGVTVDGVSYTCARVLVMSDRLILLDRDRNLSKCLLYSTVTSVHHSTLARDDLVLESQDQDGVVWIIAGNSGQDVQRLLECLGECAGGGEDFLKAVFMENFVLKSKNNELIEDLILCMRREKDDQVVEALTDLFHYSKRDVVLLETILKVDMESVQKVDLLFREDNVLSVFFSKIARESIPFLEKTVFHVLRAAEAAMPDSTVVLMSMFSLSSTPLHEVSSTTDGLSCKDRCNLLVNLMVKHKHLLPPSLCLVWRTAARLAEEKFPGSTMHVTGTLVLLRWLCPSLVVTKAWGHQGLNLRPPTRNLALQISKNLQWLTRSENPADNTLAAQVKAECQATFDQFCQSVLNDETHTSTPTTEGTLLEREDLKEHQKELNNAAEVIMTRVCRSVLSSSTSSKPLTEALQLYRFMRYMKAVGLRAGSSRKKSSSSSTVSTSVSTSAESGILKSSKLSYSDEI